MKNALILPEPAAVLPALITERDQFLEHVGTLAEATTVESVNALNAALTKCGALIKKVEAYRKSYTQPLDDFKDLCMSQQKECVAPLVEVQTAIKTELASYQTRIAQQARDREKLREAEEAKITTATAGSKHVTPALVIMEPAPEVAKVHTRKEPRLVITDLSLIPRQYFELNERALMKFLCESEVNAVLGAHVVYDDKVVTGRAQ